LLYRGQPSHTDRDEVKSVIEAREAAEALFRHQRPSTQTGSPPDEPSTRKPRILRASLPVHGPEPGDVPHNSEPQTTAPTLLHRDRLNRVRAALLRQQRELEARLGAIDNELRAIDVYVAFRKGEAPPLA
jgi:hypothetical protein